MLRFRLGLKAKIFGLGPGLEAQVLGLALQPEALAFLCLALALHLVALLTTQSKLHRNCRRYSTVNSWVKYVQ